MGHIHELIDWTATVFVVFENKVLLRWHEKYHMWIGVGGHIELDEDPATAAVRECLEEVGLAVELFDNSDVPPEVEVGTRHLPLPAHMNIHHIGGTSGKHQHVDLLYYATSRTDHVVPEHPDDQWQWFTEAELLAQPDVHPQVKFYAMKALETLGR